MKLSTKARYGIRAMVDLALHYDQEPVFLKDMAKRQEVSMKYLDHIISILKTKNLVKNAKKRHSGYILSKSPSNIKAYEIIQALEGSLTPLECVDDPKICYRSGFCVTINLWSKLKKAMEDVLQKVSLEDLAKEQREKIEQREEANMYYI